MGPPMTDQTAFASALQRKIDTKTKPIGALGRIEELASQIATLQGTLTPELDRCQLTIFAADHGIAESGVSLYPQDVTRQMVLNFASGGAAANIFSETAGVALRVVDAGVAGEAINAPGVLNKKIAKGTRNSLNEPAMTSEQRDQALQFGEALGKDGDWHAAAFGEMGIGNTSSASLIAHKMSGIPLNVLIGRGTGLDEPGLKKKHEILARAASRTGDLAAMDVLNEYGGFEIAMMAGAMIGAARSRRVVIVDGYIATSAAMVALEMEPSCRTSMVFAHMSEERGHKAMMEFLNAKPLLDLNLRLGEGTGALLAWPLLKAAVAMLNDMASFESAGVSGPA